jgi:hypothetical protein
MCCVTACKKDIDNSNSGGEQKLPDGLAQTWKVVKINGKEIVTDETKILQIKDRESANLIQRMCYDTIPHWKNMLSSITYKNDTLKIIGTIDFPVTHVVLTYKILEVNEKKLKMKLISEYVNNKLKPETIGQEIEYEPAPANVGAKIYGMWKSNIGSPDPFGLYFKNTGEYDYYYYNSQGGTDIKGDNEGYYWFYENFLVLCYKNTHGTHDQKQHLECWTVKIVETTDPDNPKNMTLTAIDKDGASISITFNFLGQF